MWVVKLGGSLAAAAELPAWLDVLGGGAGRRRVIVPGGGPFADEVREAQRRHPFPDSVAHRMAVLATEQYGLMLCGLAPGFRPAATPEAIRAALEAGETPVWMAARMTEGADDIPACWDATSDSLAAWLAGRLGAELLVLVKAAAPAASGREAVPLAEAQAAGVIDAAFTRFAGAAGFAVRWLGPRDHRAMAGALAGGAWPGARVALPGDPDRRR